MLTSRSFRMDGKLQQCLVSDQAHVAPGSVGLHVGRIQLALLALDDVRIAANELSLKRYGPSTAAAVLAYKRKRRIINPAYQTQADDIVGKMTIASLDQELNKLDKVHMHTAFCGHGLPAHPSGVRAAPVRSAFVAAPVAAPTKKPHFNKQLRLLFQITSIAESMGSFFMLDDLWNRARFLMGPYRLQFDGERPPKGHILPHDQLVDVHFTSDTFAIRRLSLNADTQPDNVLRVIFCPFAEKNPYFGITCGGPAAEGEPAVPKFVLINHFKRHKDSGTLLHEMIHAATPGVSDSTDHDKQNPKSVFSVSDDGRDQLPEQYAERLSKGFFA